jgi:hypothetical protein
MLSRLGLVSLALFLTGEMQAQTDHKPSYGRLKSTFEERGGQVEGWPRRLHEMVMADADQTLPLMPEALLDEDPHVRDEAAEWLAIRGDSRGLDFKMRCISDRACIQRFRDIERVGNSHRTDYAAPLARLVEDAISRSWKDGRWTDQADKLLVHDGVVALAKLGRREDHELILRVASTDPSFRYFKALGYVDDPRSRTLLRSALDGMSAQERHAGGHVEPLLALSRLRDSESRDLFERILKSSRHDRWLPNENPVLSGERARAFDSLRSRDAADFAESVFAVAAQVPEGPGTREAWYALGVMHPKGYAKRLLALAVSRKPWQTVARESQLQVILEIEPDPAFVALFFSSFADVQQIPDKTKDIMLIRAGLGDLLYGSAWYWIGE